MKNVMKSFYLSLAILFFVGCAPSGLQVGADRATDAGIADFKTYNWVSNVENIPGNEIYIGTEGVLIFNNMSTRKMVKDAVQTQLEARGFRRDVNNPDMLVNFKIIEQDGELRTYTREEGAYSFTYLDEGPRGQNVKMVPVKAGTILVNFMDAQSGLQVWQGFASSALERTDVKDEQIIKRKVAAIFDRFNFSGFKSLGSL